MASVSESVEAFNALRIKILTKFQTKHQSQNKQLNKDDNFLSKFTCRDVRIISFKIRYNNQQFGK